MTEHTTPRIDLLLRRMAGAAAIAFALSATPAMAAPLTCASPFESDPASDPNAFRCEVVSNFYAAGTDVSGVYGYDFSFGYSFVNVLTFEEVIHDFTLFLTAYFIDPSDPGTFLSEIPAGYQPETFSTTFGPAWIYFYVEDFQDPSCAPTCSEPTQGIDYSGPWSQDIFWFGDGTYNLPQVLHDADGGDSIFDDVITVPGSFDEDPDPCEFGCGSDLLRKAPGDPVITGSADDFRRTTVVSTVPEPATMWLLGIAAAGAAYRRRRRTT